MIHDTFCCCFVVSIMMVNQSQEGPYYNYKIKLKLIRIHSPLSTLSSLR